TVRAQSSRVPTSLPDDPYVAVRQAYLVDTNTESRPFEDLREIKVPQPLLVVPSPVLPSDDVHLTVGQAHTLAIVDTESELEEAPSEIEESLPLDSRAPLTDEEFEASKPSNTRTTLLHSSSSSDSTTPLSPDHPLTQTSPTSTPTRALFHPRVTEAMALSDSAFRKRYRSSYETPSPSPSLTLPVQKRYQGTSELIEDTEGESSKPNSEREGLEDESSDSDEEEATPEDIKIDPRSCAPVQTPTSPEWSSGLLPILPSSPAVPSPIASPVTTPVATISLDED
ncbi:hypothetical protein Tco_1560437, partial [Tanacetum coccineum]